VQNRVFLASAAALVRLADPLIDGSDKLTSLVEDGEFFVYLNFRVSHLLHEKLELGF
jgi:hypothetical protein